MADIKTVFISSTSRDLLTYREKVKQVVLLQRMHPIGMEEFHPSRQNALQTCYDEMLQADIFVGIYAHRYGYVPETAHAYTTNQGIKTYADGKTSITHMEYLWALERDIPMLLFVLSDTDTKGKPMPWPPEYVDQGEEATQLENFKSLIMRQHTIRFFNSEEDIAIQLAASLGGITVESKQTLSSSVPTVNTPKVAPEKPAQNEPSQRQSQKKFAIDWRFWVAGILLPVIAILVTLWQGNSQQTPVIAPDNAQTTSWTAELYFGDSFSLTFVATSDIPVVDLMLVSDKNRDFPAMLLQDFSAEIENGILQDGACLQYQRGGVAAELPRVCRNADIVSNVITSDPFWYDDANETMLEIEVIYGDSTLENCLPTDGRCAINK